MKKFISVVLVLTMLLSLAACGSKSETSVAPVAPAAPAASSAAPAAPVEKKISGTVVVCSSAPTECLDAIKEGFEEAYPDCEVEFITCSAGEGVAKVQAEGDNPSIDVFYSGLNQGDGTKYKDIFEPYVSKYDSILPKEYQSNNGYYNYDHLSTVVLCVNKELEKELGLNIKSYKDLLDPKLKGKIIFSDPNSSSAAWNNVANWFACYGNDSAEAWEVMEGLIKNGMVVGSSSSTCFKGVDKGEYVVGITYEDGASTLLKNGSEAVDMRYATDGASAWAFAAAIVKKAPNMDAAKAMIDWLQSPEGQQYQADLGIIRVTNPDVTGSDSVLPASKDVKWVVRDVEWLVANKTAMLEKWNAMVQKYAK